MVGRRILAAVFLSATLGVTMARAQEPVDVLAKNGLTKSGTFFVIASEEPVMQKLYNLRPVMGQMEQKYMAVAAIYQNEYEYQMLNDYRIQVQGHLNDVRGQVNAMPRAACCRDRRRPTAQQYHEERGTGAARHQYPAPAEEKPAGRSGGESESRARFQGASRRLCQSQGRDVARGGRGPEAI